MTHGVERLYCALTTDDGRRTTDDGGRTTDDRLKS